MYPPNNDGVGPGKGLVVPSRPTGARRSWLSPSSSDESVSKTTAFLFEGCCCWINPTRVGMLVDTPLTCVGESQRLSMARLELLSPFCWFVE